MTVQPVRRAFERAAGSYDAAAEVQRAVARRLAARLDGLAALRMTVPCRVLDLGSGTGFGEQLLRERLPGAELVELDIAQAMLAVARASRVSGASLACLPVCGDLERLPLVGGCMDLAWSSLALQWASDPARAFAELFRVLKPGGVLHVATLGPGTLAELAESFSDVDRYRHVNRFVPAGDLATVLAGAGFVDCHLVEESVVAEYDNLGGVLKSLKAIGAGRVVESGVPGLMGKARWAKAASNYETLRRNGMLPATYRAIYITAYKPAVSPL